MMAIALRKQIWDSMLDADMNARYWSTLTRRYTRYDTGSKIFLAAMSSGTVAGWGLWSDVPILWKTLSAASALLAIGLTAVNLPKQITRLADQSGQWLQLFTDYELLWLEDGAMTAAQQKHYQDIRKREASVKKNEVALPEDLKLLRTCQGAVIRSRGLLPAQPNREVPHA